VIRWPSLHHFVAAAILVAIAGPIVVFAYVKSGAFNVAASHPHSRLVEWLTHETMINSVKRRASDVALPQRIEIPRAIAGFCQYQAHCVACHGAAAVAREQWVSGFNPQPPYLLDAGRRWSPDQLYWIVRNGIKMTGMPAWRESMTNNEIRDVTLFVEAMERMPPQTYIKWRSAQLCGPK
jgi:hypothetical protein